MSTPLHMATDTISLVRALKDVPHFILGQILTNFMLHNGSPTPVGTAQALINAAVTVESLVIILESLKQNVPAQNIRALLPIQNPFFGTELCMIFNGITNENLVSVLSLVNINLPPPVSPATAVAAMGERKVPIATLEKALRAMQLISAADKVAQLGWRFSSSQPLPSVGIMGSPGVQGRPGTAPSSALRDDPPASAPKSPSSSSSSSKSQYPEEDYFWKHLGNHLRDLTSGQAASIAARYEMFDFSGPGSIPELVKIVQKNSTPHALIEILKKIKAQTTAVNLEKLLSDSNLVCGFWSKVAPYLHNVPSEVLVKICLASGVRIVGAGTLDITMAALKDRGFDIFEIDRVLTEVNHNFKAETIVEAFFSIPFGLLGTAHIENSKFTDQRALDDHFWTGFLNIIKTLSSEEIKGLNELRSDKTRVVNAPNLTAALREQKVSINAILQQLEGLSCEDIAAKVNRLALHAQKVFRFWRCVAATISAIPSDQKIDLSEITGQTIFGTTPSGAQVSEILRESRVSPGRIVTMLRSHMNSIGAQHLLEMRFTSDLDVATSENLDYSKSVSDDVPFEAPALFWSALDEGMSTISGEVLQGLIELGDSIGGDESFFTILRRISPGKIVDAIERSGDKIFANRLRSLLSSGASSSAPAALDPVIETVFRECRVTLTPEQQAQLLGDGFCMEDIDFIEPEVLAPYGVSVIKARSIIHKLKNYRK